MIRHVGGAIQQHGEAVAQRVGGEFLVGHLEQVIESLDGFVTVDEAASLLSCSTANVRRLITGSNFRTVVQLGAARPFYLLSETEVRAMAEDRAS